MQGDELLKRRCKDVPGKMEKHTHGRVLKRKKETLKLEFLQWTKNYNLVGVY